MSMYFVYILFSISRNKCYVGSSSDVATRLLKHNTNQQGFTGTTDDWEIKHQKEFSTKQEASKRERQIKSWKSWLMIEKLIYPGD